MGNLGSNKNGYCPRNFMEEYMAEGAPYFRALYDLSPGGDAQPVPLLNLVLEAKKLLDEGFPRPVPVGANLSPVGLVFKAYMWKRYRGTSEEKGVAGMAPTRLIKKGPVNGNQGFFDIHVCIDMQGGPPPKNTVNICLMTALRKSFDKRFPDLGDSHGRGWFKTGGV